MPTAQRSASGSSAMATSAPTRAASSSSASAAPGSSGLGKATVGKSGSGANWLATVCTSSKPAALQRAQRELAADTVHGGQRHPRLSRAVRRSVGRARDVGVHQCVIGRLHGQAGDLVGRRCGGHRGLDLAVGGRDDLQAAVEIHLVAVVGSRVVRGGDLHPGGGAGVPDRERDDRGRHRVFPGDHRKAMGGKHFSRSGGELRRPVPGVAAHHDGRAAQAAVGQHPRQRPADPQHHREVHRVRAAAHRPAQPGGAECQRPGEAGGELVGIQGGQFGGRDRIGIVGDPVLGGHGTDCAPRSASASLRSTGAVSISRLNSSSER